MHMPEEEPNEKNGHSDHERDPCRAHQAHVGCKEFPEDLHCMLREVKMLPLGAHGRALSLTRIKHAAHAWTRINSSPLLTIQPHHVDGIDGRDAIVSMAGRSRNYWRRDPESNRADRICNPVHNRFAIAPVFLAVCRVQGWHCTDKKGKPGLPFSMEYGAGKESRTLDLNLGKVALYQLSYSRVSSPEVYNNFWGGSKVSRNFFPFARRLIASCISA
jgi:hypothetical protein